MAMRPTSRQGGTTPSRATPEAVVRPVYEDFRPMVEWQQDDESNILLIYLPGFQRENLKVSTEGRNILRIRGERLIAGNKWSRFQEDYPIPEGCNVRGISARFEAGILTIIIPRIEVIKDASTIKEPTKAPQDTTPKPSQKIKEDLSTQKQQQISPPKKAPEKMQQKAADDISGPTAIPPVSALGKGGSEITQETSPDDQKISSEKPKSILNEKPKEPQEDALVYKSNDDLSGDAIYKGILLSKTLPKDLIRPLTAEKVPDKSEEESKAKKDLIRPLKAEKVPDKSEEESKAKKDLIRPLKAEKFEEEGRYYPKGALKTKKVADQVEDIMREKKVIKPKLQKDKGKIIEPKERKTTRAVAASSRSDYGLASYKKTVKQFLESNEDRLLLVNAGVAVLVLVAFGVYLSYTIHDKLHEI